MRFPLVGSAVLFGLYIVIKLVNKDYLDILIAIYFSVIGAFGMFGASQAPITSALKQEDAARWTREFHYEFWKKEEDRGARRCQGVDREGGRRRPTHYGVSGTRVHTSTPSPRAPPHGTR